MELQFSSRYQVNNYAIHTAWEAIPKNFNIFIWKVEILKETSQYGAENSSNNTFSDSKSTPEVWFSLVNDITVQDHAVWISILLTHYLKHNDHIIKIYPLNWSLFALFRLSFKVLYLLIWKCYTEILNKAYKNSIFLSRNLNFQDFLNDHLSTQTTILKKVFLVNYQTHVPRDIFELTYFIYNDR